MVCIIYKCYYRYHEQLACRESTAPSSSVAGVKTMFLAGYFVRSVVLILLNTEFSISVYDFVDADFENTERG